MLASSGLIKGGTSWPTHFLAMRAVPVAVPVNYGMVATIGSIGIARGLGACRSAGGTTIVSAGSLALLSALSRSRNRSPA
jgi:NO-binding membrane sensor protein with MHYT domain